jgi:hypothetical protein
VGSGRLTRRQLNNLKTAEPETDRMRTQIPVVQDDFLSHMTDLTVEQVKQFSLREDGSAQEVPVLPVSR